MSDRKCSLCGSKGVTKTTCPLNPAAKHPNQMKHGNQNPPTNAKIIRPLSIDTFVIEPTPEPNIVNYRDDQLNLDFYPSIVLNTADLMNTLIQRVEWNHAFVPDKRSYGNYQNPYWLDCLLPAKMIVEQLTKVCYSRCVVQYYPNGTVGIRPHRDKELPPNSTISGLSLGQTRHLVMQRSGKRINIPLVPGSLYVMNPPTNDYWTHCIETDQTIAPRLSLTFRNSEKNSCA